MVDETLKLYCLCAALVGGFDKLLFMLFHIRRYSLQVCKDKFFQYAFADIMRSAEHIISCPVAVVAASVGEMCIRDRWRIRHGK